MPTNHMPGTARPRARKRFGQHFLRDKEVVDRILSAIDPRPTDHFVEIGPGTGVLTFPILDSGSTLDAIEIDRDLATGLRDVSRRYPARFTLHVGDALRFDFPELALRRGPLRLIGNLPYNISTPLLFRLLQAAPEIRDMHFMLQKEVVARLTAEPGTHDYGRLTVSVAARALTTSLFDVGPEAFTPQPRVQSSVVRITPRPAPFPVPSLALYDHVVTAAFSKRRKTLANALRGLIREVDIATAGIDPLLRPERIEPTGYARLAQILAENQGCQS